MLFSNHFPQVHAAHEGNSPSYNWLATKLTMVTSLRLERSSRILHCGYFHSEQAWKEPGGNYPLPLMSEHPAHSSRPAADLAVFQ